MSRRLVGVLFALSLAGCASTPSARHKSWEECAVAEATKMLQSGISPSWPQAAELAQGQRVVTVDLGPSPPEAVEDAFMRTLHLVPGLNAFYLKQTGGFAGVNQLFGPVALKARCAAPEAGAP